MIRQGATAQRFQTDLRLKSSLTVKYFLFPIKGHSGTSKGCGKNRVLQSTLLPKIYLF